MSIVQAARDRPRTVTELTPEPAITWVEIPVGPAAAAIDRFVHNGGGLLLVGDHTNLLGMGTHHSLFSVARYFARRARRSPVLRGALKIAHISDSTRTTIRNEAVKMSRIVSVVCRACTYHPLDTHEAPPA